MAQTNSFINVTTTGTVIGAGGGILSGMYVHSISSATLKLWHGTTSAEIGSVIGGNFSPAAGYHNLGNLNTTAGVYIQGVGSSGGSWNITFHIKYSD